ncbi:TPA: phage tail protein [Pseudomonas aeruginosa]|uniref:phage tail assembly chaperone n=1 Tax=Pseudomonas aeruginosa TaxID=287 RepID=UPI00053F239F|nr:phage tail assembly chaperone [Pseudomonas aeruginosa]EIU2540602.1 phage tail protein [Pseudomonas aeruginosa]EKX7106263.1 phage tail protein [Pseudomonas aeruginosa]ELK4907691.1 phage tail protein [Pseudomonas aeruginosa]KAA5656325.1 phage tail protein [Pseudomonas aeruginosa]KKJ41653.1 phage tail protein [Pseudomonas aeruginosa MRSN 317]
MFFYCPKTGGFYSPEVHGEQMPAESELWPLTDEEYEALLDAQGQGLLIVAGEDGQPVATPPPPLGDEALATIERDWRDRQLDDTDALVARHRDELEVGTTTLSAEQYQALQAYRRQLRDWPESGEFPLAEHRPAAPDWLEALFADGVL